MPRCIAKGLCVLVLLAGCAGQPAAETAQSTPEAAPAPEASGRKKPVASARGTNGMILQVSSAERLSAGEAKISLRIFNPGATPQPQTVDLENFYIAPLDNSTLPVVAVDKAKTTLKPSVLQPRENIEGDVYFKTPGPGAMAISYGTAPELSVNVVRIPAQN